MSKKWMPVTAGILEILAGFWMLISLFFLIGFSEGRLDEPHEFMLPAMIFILGVLALVGGVFASINRKWRLALAGGVGIVTLPFITFSVLAAVIEYDYNISRWYVVGFEVLISISPVILLILSKREFK